MPRQRKPQNSGQTIGARRVANTTTTPTLQTVYRIPTNRGWDCCNAVAYEITWVSPIRVQIEGENIYRISLDPSALEALIEDMNLDLSNVTLETINGDVTFTGAITAEGTFEGTSVQADTLTATTWTIDTLTSTDATITNLDAIDVSTATLETSWDASVGWNLTVAWTSTLTWDVTAGSDLSVTWNTTTDWLTATTWTIATLNSTDATITNLDATSWDITTLTSDEATLWQLSVSWTSSFTGDITAGNISASWNTSLNNLSTSWNATLANVTVNGASTLTGNASVGGNLSVSGNSTVTGNQTVTGDGIFSNDVTISRDLNVSGDATITDDLYVNGRTHLKDVETDGSVDIDGTLRVTWAIDAGNGLTSTNVVTDNLVVNWTIALGNNATAPDFILQSEKGAANGVAPLDANGKIDAQYLPPVYTTAIVKMGTGVFDNSNTSVVVDADITASSFVALSNYSDIIWDLNEVINEGQITVVSNETETWSYKYIIVNPIS